MKTKIHIVTPIITKGIRSLDDVKPLEEYGIEISHSLLDTGPSSIESEFDEALAVPDTINKCVEAEASGAAAIVIDCMGDPGVKAAREAVTIPVFGPMETSLHTAAILGQRISVVTVANSVVPMLRNLSNIYGLSEKMVSYRVIDMPVLEIEKQFEKTQDLLAEESMAAVKDDGADVIIFGCTGFLGCAELIRTRLADDDLSVPVIDPIPLTVLQAAAIANAGYSHSKRTYPFPRDKQLAGFEVQPASFSV